jgi:hypothetical protein
VNSTRDPWADPDTPTEPGAPYAGPPTTAPPSPDPTAPQPGYGSYAYPGYAPPGYGYPYPYPVLPSRPRRPGQVIASAVLAFVQSAMVLIASLYVWFFASIVTVVTAGAPGSLDAEGLATEATVLAAVQLASAILLVVAGVLALNRRGAGTWKLLLGAHGLQVALAVYWWARLVMLAEDFPQGEVDGFLLGFTLFFAAAPAVGLGLLWAGASRRWFQDTPQA